MRLIFNIMEKTFTQLYVHAIFTVQNREPLINKNWRDRLYLYITAIVQNHGHKMLAIGGSFKSDKRNQKGFNDLD